jgi:hypothetical protein
VVLILIQRARGVLHVLYAGDFTQAKTWAREHYGEALARFSDAKWKAPQECEYWTAKDQAQFGHDEAHGPVAMKFVKEQIV